MAKRKREISRSVSKDAKNRFGLNANTFPCSSNGLVVKLIFPGEKHCFYGVARIQCLAGELIIDKFAMPSGGYLNAESMYMVCAPYRLSRPAVFYSPAADKMLIKYKLNRLKYRLKEITPHYERIMETVAEKYPAVIVIDQKPSQTVKILDQLLQEFFVPSTSLSSCQYDRTLFFKSDYEPYVEVSERELQAAMEEINTMRTKQLRCIVVPVGNSGSGKSTLVRHIVNANLQQEFPIYLLDADVGQSEFTPAGCMSLWKIVQPILDIPCTHQQQIYPSAYFFGNISPADDTEKYKVIFDRLLNEFESTSDPGSLLIINTLGWIDGLGCELLNHIFDVARPHLALRLSSDRGFAIPSYVKNIVSIVPKCKPFQFQMNLPESHGRPTRLLSSQLRDIALVAYFSTALPRPILSSICDAQPYCVKFK
ncbi:hypothetical protein RB195_000229 [Necator americanus]|uniref:Clp1 P-loop domain-containing protein n=1 Tax=Necator americanus TaxID=51031 RepID=A0ABR1D9G7_NECAM